MSGNNEKVQLDLNSPQFQSDFFDLDPSEIKKLTKTFKKLRGMTWSDVFRDHGLRWEELKTVTGQFSIRLSQSYRAVLYREGGWMRLVSLHPDHDAAYGKK
jgi:hypothetical protein